VLTHPSIRKFWRVHFNEVYKLSSSQLVDATCVYIRQDASTIEGLNEDDITLIANKFHETLGRFGCYIETVTVQVVTRGASLIS